MSNVALSVTKRGRRLGRLPFAMGLAVILIAGMVGLLILSIKIQSASVELRQAQSQAAALGNEAAALSAEVDRVSSVTNLQQQAMALGMCPDAHTVFIDLTTGLVTGEQTRATCEDLTKIMPPSDGAASPPVQVKIYPGPNPAPADAGDN